jgi:hypothetical protein
MTFKKALELGGNVKKLSDAEPSDFVDCSHPQPPGSTQQNCDYIHDRRTPPPICP